MKQFFIFVGKEFKHVFRDRKTLLMLFGLPVVQIILFGFALTNETKNTALFVLDYARDKDSRQLIDKIGASAYFEVVQVSADPSLMEAAFHSGKVKSALVFPQKFSYALHHEGTAQLRIITDGSDPNTASTIKGYLQILIAEFQRSKVPLAAGLQVNSEVRMLYNPELKGAYNFVPGVMALVLMLVCVLMTSISIVREKENGTMEILLVSPFKPILVLLSKAVPYLLVSFFNLLVILALSVLVLGLPIKGSLLLLLFVSTLYIITALALGLLISTATSSQQAAMLLSMMGMLLPTMLFAGFMFPIENMPMPLQYFSNIVPARWYYIIVKSIMIKGLGITAIAKEILVLTGMTLLLLGLSLKKFKIRLE